MSAARYNILNKLKAAHSTALPEPEVFEYYQNMSPTWDSDIDRLKHWAKTMRAVKTEIFWVTPDDWTAVLNQVLEEKSLHNILLPTATQSSQQAAQAIQAAGKVQVRYFDRAIEDWKDEFFHDVQAGFTDVRCGIAQTGTVMLFPTPAEPRSLSLVPPVHICLFDASRMYDTFHAAMRGENMVANMPTNVVLVSGPSKTADIQLTLAFGAHGPKDMVILAILPQGIKAEDLAE